MLGGFPLLVPGAVYSQGDLQEPKLCANPLCSQSLTLSPALMGILRLQGWIRDTRSPRTAENTGLCGPWWVCSSCPALLRHVQGCPAPSRLIWKCR